MTRPSLTKADRERRERDAAARAAQRAAQARQSSVEHCSICGTIPAPFGYAFGALHACMDRECQAEAEARAYPKAETERAA